MSTTANRSTRKPRPTAKASLPAAAKPPKAAGKKAVSEKVAAKPAPSAPVAKPPKKPKPVLVRDGFTMPEADFALIAALKKRAAAAGREAKKSEVLRAGLQALATLEVAALVASLNALQPVKVGRPRKGH